MLMELVDTGFIRRSRSRKNGRTYIRLSRAVAEQAWRIAHEVARAKPTSRRAERAAASRAYERMGGATDAGERPVMEMTLKELES